MDRLVEMLTMMQQNGEFEGMPEDTLDFTTMDNDDLVYYLEWLDEESYQEIALIVDLEDIMNSLGTVDSDTIRKMLEETLDRL